MARKGGHNRGIVLKNGKWWARVYVAGREKWYRADNKSQAKAIYARIQAEKREMRYFPEQFDPVKTITLRAWIGRCLEGMASRGLRNMPHYGKFWQRLLGPIPLADISAEELRHLQAKMAARQTRSHRTINRYFAALRRFLNLALAEGYLKSNPVLGVRFFPEPTGRLRFLSEAEIEKLRDHLSPEHWAIVAFALETGLRLSEQFQARWDCVDIEHGILTVPLSKSGKTRHVMLTDAALAIVRGLSSWTHSPYLFPSPLSSVQPMQGRNFVVKVYDRALKQAGIADATWHTLRHTFASRKVMAGADIRAVQELMGHSTITMTMRYAHLSPAHLRRAANMGSLGAIAMKSESRTGSKTGSEEISRPKTGLPQIAEVPDIPGGMGGGAGRVRTAASQFCRLLP